MSGGRWRGLGKAVRAVVGLALLAVLLLRLDPRQVVGSFAGLVWGAVALAALAQAAAKLVWVYRWREILRANGLERGFWDLLAVVFIGLFFNNFLPTAVGGDLVRGYYAAGGRQGLASSYASVVIERALGILSLAVLAATASGIALVAGGTPLPRTLLTAVVAVGVLAVVGGLAAFSWRGWRPLAERWSRRAGRAAHLLESLARGMELFRRPATPRLAIVGSSLALQAIAVLFHLACARAVGLGTPALVFFLVVPASVVASMLPVTLNGLGLREGTLVGLLVLYGAPAGEAGAFALLALLLATTFALAGGLVYPFYRLAPLEADRAQLDA